MSTWHVIPNNDTHPHDEATTCNCHPNVQHVNGNMVVVHNSFDGREGVEMFTEVICCCLDWKSKQKCDGNCHT